MADTEKKIIKTKVYTLKVEVADDGTQRLTRTNDGFNTLELIGLMSSVLLDLVSPNLPKLEFEKVTRRIVEQEENKESN
jgi:hypothetical protein